MRKFVIPAVTMFVVLVLVGCSSTADVKTNVLGANSSAAVSGLKTPVEAAQLLAGPTAGKSVRVLDVRTPEEFTEGCLAGAQNIDIRGGSFEQQIAGLDKTASYLVYCRTGKRSADAANRMKEAGFTNVLDLQGGITAWQETGNPVSRECGRQING
jgi:rhodanese-related sulfurtransferase